MLKHLENINAALQRELQIMLSRPLYLIATVAVLGVCCFFFISIMRQGVPERMPMAVVDMDATPTSRNIIRQLNSMQLVKVKMVCNSYAEARKATQKGQIYGFLYIPQHFTDDMLAFRRPTLTFYTNNAYTVGANMVYKQILTMCNLVSGSFHLQVLQKKGLPDYQAMAIVQPIVIEGHQIANPTSNYSIYLLGTMIPGILGLIVLTCTIYCIGIELKNRTSPEWIETAGGSFIDAMLGKLIPYSVLFGLLGIAINILMFQLMHFPVEGSYFRMSVGLLLYVFIMQVMGVLIIGAVPVLRSAMSIGALYGMMGFSLSGFTFPDMGMLPFVRGISWLFPLKYYYKIYVNEALLDGPIENTLIPIAALILFLFTPMLVNRRLKYAAINLNYKAK